MAAAYAAVLSLINTLNQALRYNPSVLGCLTWDCSALLHKYEWDEDREALESAFRAANGEGLLPNIVSLIRRLEGLMTSQQVGQEDCPQEYVEFLSHYKLYFPREALKIFSPGLKLPVLGAKNEHFWGCYDVIHAWRRLDYYLNCQLHIQDFKPSVCLLETFLRDHPPMNKTDRKQIQVLANEAEALIDTLMPNLPSVLRGYRKNLI